MVQIKGEIVIDRLSRCGVATSSLMSATNPALTYACAASKRPSNGPVGPGTQFRAQNYRYGRTVEMVIEFTVYERPPFF